MSETCETCGQRTDLPKLAKVNYGHMYLSLLTDELWDDMCLPDEVRAEYAKVYPNAAKAEQE